MTQLNRSILGMLLALGLVAAGASAATAQDTEEETYSENEILAKAKGFFGMTTEGLAKAIEKVFEDLGRPNAYIIGEEISGAIGIGVRYGNGILSRKTGGSRKD